MIIIVEGIDRVGKTTFIDKMCEKRKLIRLKDSNVCSKTYGDDDFGSFSLGKLDTSVAFLKQLNEQGFDIIVDRLHLTELVYGKTKHRQVCENKIYELDRILSSQKCILVYVQPTDINWSNKQAGEDQTTLYRNFNFEYSLSGIEKYYTNFHKLDRTVELLNDRMNQINKLIADRALRQLAEKGRRVNDTIELISYSAVFANITTQEIKNTFEIDSDLFRNFKYDVDNKIDTKYGSYQINKYFGLFNRLYSAMEYLKTDNIYTRRCIISFENEHCFQNIQFIIRNNKLVVVCNMRSCNIVDNYQNDIMICSLLADAFKEEFHKYDKEYKLEQQHDIIMNIGSLHIFVKEGDNDASK
jgi:thymidylate kinase